MAHFRPANWLRHSLSHPVRALRRAANAWRLAPWSAIGVLAASLFLGASTAHAVDLTGLSQEVAIDQPQTNMLVRNVVNGVEGDPQVGQTLAIVIDPDGNPDIVEENTINITAYLDTGTSSILLSTDTASVWGVPNSTFNGQQVQFQDIGIGGAANFTVSKPVTIQLAPYNTGTNNTLSQAQLGKLRQLLLSATRTCPIRSRPQCRW